MPKHAKSKRKSWQKVNVDDIEEARDDEQAIGKIKNKSLKGQGPVDEMEDLFTVDTKGSCEGLSGASRRAIARAKIFPPKAPNIGISAIEGAKIARAEAGMKFSRKRPKTAPDAFDLWAEPDTKAKRESGSTVRTVPQKGPSKAPKTLAKKGSAVPAVLLAHEGQSMNPESSAFEDLACMAAARELEREAEAEALDRKLHPMSFELKDAHGADAFKGMDEEAKVKAYRELSCPSAVAAEAAGAGSETEEAAEERRAKVQRTKSQAHRNREQKRKNIDAKTEQLRQQKILNKSVGEVGAIMKELKEKEEWYEGRKAFKDQQRLKRKHLEETEGVVPSTRRLGRTRFEEEAMLVPNSEAASKGLRAMPLSGTTAIKERLSSIVRRGLLPAMPAFTKEEVTRRKKQVGKLKRSRKFASPLLRNSLLSR